jgi:hypothetical protein
MKSSLKRYYNNYGGAKSIMRSPLFIFSVVFTAVNYQNWVNGSWVQLSLSLLPNLIGVSLGSYAIVFGLLSDTLRRALAKTNDERGVSYLDSLNAAFFHFLIFQILALLWALAGSSTFIVDLIHLFQLRCLFCIGGLSYASRAYGFLGHLFFLYSVFLIFASALMIFRVASIRLPSQHQ